MKKVFLLSLFLCSCSAISYITEEQRHVDFLEQHNQTKEKAFDAALEWIATNFHSANDVIQLKDKENGKIIVQAVGSYYYDILHTLTNNYYFTISIKLADNKIKFEFTTGNIVGGNYLPQQGNLEQINDNYKLIEKNILTAINDYTGSF